MFTPEQRDRVRRHVLRLAAADPRVVAGAVVGSLANGGGDRFSDLDLTFGLAAGAEPIDVLDDWREELDREFAAAHLFDLPSGAALYRVFLLPGSLQVDLSCAPREAWGAGGPSFELLFGEAAERPQPSVPAAGDLFGLGAHHAVRARFCVERGRVWQAAYWIAGVRDLALGLACRRLGLPTAHGRGFDRLPADVLAPLEAALVRSLDRDELLRALASAVDGLLREADEARGPADRVEAELRALTEPGWL